MLSFLICFYFSSSLGTLRISSHSQKESPISRLPLRPLMILSPCQRRSCEVLADNLSRLWTNIMARFEARLSSCHQAFTFLFQPPLSAHFISRYHVTPHRTLQQQEHTEPPLESATDAKALAMVTNSGPLSLPDPPLPAPVALSACDRRRRRLGCGTGGKVPSEDEGIAAADALSAQSGGWQVRRLQWCSVRMALAGVLAMILVAAWLVVEAAPFSLRPSALVC